MEINNANFGQIDSNGGSIHIGNIKNIFIGLSDLVAEYKEQLKTIESLLDQFKVKTAFDILLDLEKRVRDNEHPDKDKVLSKIIYLKGICQRELPDLKVDVAARNFITAYQSCGTDLEIRDRACVEYLNLEERAKAAAFAEEILKNEPYNISAWYVKALTAGDLKSFIPSIPNTVLSQYNFQLGLVQHIVVTGQLLFFEDLSDYGLTLKIDFSKYKKLTFTALEGWRITIDLSINKFLNEYSQKYICGDEFIYSNSLTIDDAIQILATYVETLQNTEMSELILHQQFFLSYLLYLRNNDQRQPDILKSLYPRIHKDLWFYTFCFCQVLNHKKEYQYSLDCVLQYESNGGELYSEIYLFKGALFHLNGRSSEVIDIFTDYLNSLEIIEERNGLNIVNAFVSILYKKLDEDILELQLAKIKEKEFKNEELKGLLEIIITTRFFKNFDREEIYEKLCVLQEFREFDIKWKTLIAESFNSIGRRKESIEFLRTFLDKTKITETLRFYIVLLHEQLCDRNDQERGFYVELLELLKFWRKNAYSPDRQLLEYEHNLYGEINDFDEIEKIDQYLYENFPSNEQYILSYLHILERRQNFSKLKEVSENIEWEIHNETFGVELSMILIRTEADTDRGFLLLYKLASNTSNTEARRNYFASQILLKEQKYFKSYQTVELGCWVTYYVGEKKDYLKIEKESGLQKDFLGRRCGETFTTSTGVSQRITTIYIHEILNDAWHLFRTIQDQAANPVNELGFEALQTPENPNDLIEFFKSHFGPLGLKDKEFKDRSLEDYFNYRLGFSEISKMVFGENYIDAYMHLTKNPAFKFTTIPLLLSKPIPENHDSLEFALDFSTLMLFYSLEKELGFEFKHRFTFSFLVKDKIEMEILELANSAPSSMTLQITPQSVTKFDTPEDFNQKRILFLKDILTWIEDNCKIDLVAEKLNIVRKIGPKESMEGMMKILVESMCIADREDFLLISSDSTLYMATRSTIGNIISPERYLNSFYPDKCGTDFYSFLLKSNYIGINIIFDTLKTEFYQYLAGGKNYYNLCLQNLQYNVHQNPDAVVMLSRFLKDLYIMPLLKPEQQDHQAQVILSRALFGMPKEVAIKFSKQLGVDFKLLGNKYVQVMKVLNNFF